MQGTTNTKSRMSVAEVPGLLTYYVSSTG